MQTPKKLFNINKVNLVYDAVIFIAFLIATAPRFSGVAIHEWLGIAFGAAIIAHLLLHWSWLVETIKRIFKALPRTTRINALLNTALFIDFVIITFTGIAISRVALPLFGIHLLENFAWRSLHDTASNIALVLIGLHLAVHWDWIVNMVRRTVFGRSGAKSSSPKSALASETEVQS